jgi:hypothetical protein
MRVLGYVSDAAYAAIPDALVGSITWVAAGLVDEHVSRITRNVPDRFLYD